MVPAGFSRSSLIDANSASISSKRGPTVRRRRSPASVGATLRVVRVRRRKPSRASSARIRWLSADWETPSCAAARVKLRSRATARNAIRSSRCSLRIDEGRSDLVLLCQRMVAAAGENEWILHERIELDVGPVTTRQVDSEIDLAVDHALEDGVGVR